MAMSRAGRRRLILAVVVVAGLAAAGGGYAFRQAQMRNNMARWLEEGTAAHERGDYEATLANLNEFVSRDKSNVEALLDFADARRRIQIEEGSSMHLLQARNVTQTALAIEPNSLRGRRMLLDLYTKFKDLRTETLDAADRVLELAPDDLDAHKARIDVFMVLGRNEEAVAAVQAMADAIPEDLSVQLDAFEKLTELRTDPGVLDAFVESRSERFEGRLGLELMRLERILTRFAAVRAGTPEADELEAEYIELLEYAAELPAGSEKEARELLGRLGELTRVSREYAPLEERTLARYMQDPMLADEMVAMAAEQAWSQGRTDDAARLVRDTLTSMESASDRALGWLALCGVDGSEDALDALALRTTAQARGWVKLAEARRLLAEGEATRALETLDNLPNLEPDALRVSLYLRGKGLAAAGELPRAAQVWGRLLADNATWAIALVDLAEAEYNLGRYVAAHAAIVESERARIRDPMLWLRIELAIDEAGLSRRVPTGRDSYQVASQLAQTIPDDPALMALQARAAIATGRMAEARLLVDDLLKVDLSSTDGDAADLMYALREVDPARAKALREALGRTATDPATVYALALADLNSGMPVEGRSRLVQGLAAAPEEDRMGWELLTGIYDDVAGTNGAADALFELSARYPESLIVQRQVLECTSVWREPDRLGPVVERLRTITGDTGYQWRLFDLKRQLASLDREGADASERAAEIQIRVAQVIREDPTNVVALTIASEAAEIAGDMNRAADFLVRASESKPLDADLQLRIPDLMAKAGRLAEANARAASLASLTLQYPGQLRKRADLLVRFGRSDLARADWEALAKVGDTASAVRFATTLAIAGQTERADAIVEDALASQDTPDTVKLVAADYYATTGRVDRGIELLGSLAAEGETGRRANLLGRYLVTTTDDLDDARRNVAIAEEDDDADLWAAAAQGYLRLGRLDEARQLTERGLASHPQSDSLRAVRQLFQAVDAQEETMRLALFATMLSLVPTPEVTAVVGAVGRRLDGEIDDATLISLLQNMSRESPGSVNVWQGLAMAQLTAGRTADASKSLRDAMDALPNSAEIAQFAASRFRELGRLEDSLFASRAWASRLGRPSWEADQTIALNLTELGRHREALDAITPWRARIMAARETEIGDAALLARNLGQTGDDAGAIEVFTPIVTASTSGLALGVELTLWLKNNDAARAWLAGLEPLILETDEPRTTMLYAAAWWQLGARTGERDDVLRTLDVLERLRGLASADRPRIRFIMGVCHEHLGESAEAAANYREALQDAPADIALFARNNLAYLLLQSGGDPAEAVELSSQAVALAKRAGTSPAEMRSYLDTHAHALVAVGRPQDAVPVYREALASDPAWPIGLIGLAEAQINSGDEDGARHTLAAMTIESLPPDLVERANALAMRLSD